MSLDEANIIDSIRVRIDRDKVIFPRELELQLSECLGTFEICLGGLIETYEDQNKATARYHEIKEGIEKGRYVVRLNERLQPVLEEPASS